MKPGGVLDKLSDVAVGIGALAALYLTAYDPHPVRWTSSEVLQLTGAAYRQLGDVAKIERAALRAELAADRAERARRSAGWVTVIASMVGAFIGYGVAQWLSW